METSENDDVPVVSMYDACLLHSRADRALRLVVSRQLEAFNITMMEWLLMGAVQHGPKEGLSMSAVAAALDVTLPQVTALTAGLTKQKLLKQKISRQDRRSRRLVCTQAGKKLLTEVETTINQAMKNWIGEIPPDELRAYFKTVEALASHRSENGRS
jgi:DNA-binding MarR family transcriptional regulator